MTPRRSRMDRMGESVIENSILASEANEINGLRNTRPFNDKIEIEVINSQIRENEQ